MEWYWPVLIIYGIITLLINAIGLLCNEVESIHNLLNPVYIYKANKVNIFGCIMLTFLGHLLFPWYIIPYWLYKLCTAGRK